MESPWNGNSTCTAYGALKITCNIKGWIPCSATGGSVHSCRDSTQKLMVAQGKNEIGYLTYLKLWESSCRTVPAVLKLPCTTGRQWPCWKQETTQSSGWDCLLKKSELGGERVLGFVYFEEI